MKSSIIPVSIKKDGVVREFYCPECDYVRLCRIIFREINQRRGTVLFLAVCLDCYNKWKNSAEASKKYEWLKVSDTFYAEIQEHNFERWNALIQINI